MKHFFKACILLFALYFHLIPCEKQPKVLSKDWVDSLKRHTVSLTQQDWEIIYNISEFTYEEAALFHQKGCKNSNKVNKEKISSVAKEVLDTWPEKEDELLNNYKTFITAIKRIPLLKAIFNNQDALVKKYAFCKESSLDPQDFDLNTFEYLRTRQNLLKLENLESLKNQLESGVPSINPDIQDLYDIFKRDFAIITKNLNNPFCAINPNDLNQETINNFIGKFDTNIQKRFFEELDSKSFCLAVKNFKALHGDQQNMLLSYQFNDIKKVFNLLQIASKNGAINISSAENRIKEWYAQENKNLSIEELHSQVKTLSYLEQILANPTDDLLKSYLFAPKSSALKPEDLHSFVFESLRILPHHVIGEKQRLLEIHNIKNLAEKILSNLPIINYQKQEKLESLFKKDFAIISKYSIYPTKNVLEKDLNSDAHTFLQNLELAHQEKCALLANYGVLLHAFNCYNNFGEQKESIIKSLHDFDSSKRIQFLCDTDKKAVERCYFSFNSAQRKLLNKYDFETIEHVLKVPYDVAKLLPYDQSESSLLNAPKDEQIKLLKTYTELTREEQNIISGYSDANKIRMLQLATDKGSIVFDWCSTNKAADVLLALDSSTRDEVLKKYSTLSSSAWFGKSSEKDVLKKYDPSLQGHLLQLPIKKLRVALDLFTPEKFTSELSSCTYDELLHMITRYEQLDRQERKTLNNQSGHEVVSVLKKPIHKSMHPMLKSFFQKSFRQKAQEALPFLSTRKNEVSTSSGIMPRLSDITLTVLNTIPVDQRDDCLKKSARLRYLQDTAYSHYPHLWDSNGNFSNQVKTVLQETFKTTDELINALKTFTPRQINSLLTEHKSKRKMLTYLDENVPFGNNIPFCHESIKKTYHPNVPYITNLAIDGCSEKLKKDFLIGVGSEASQFYNKYKADAMRITLTTIATFLFLPTGTAFRVAMKTSKSAFPSLQKFSRMDPAKRQIMLKNAVEGYSPAKRFLIGKAATEEALFLSCKIIGNRLKHVVGIKK